MTRNCDGCGREYEAKRSTSRWCSSSCRSRASRGLVPTSGGQALVDGFVTAATVRDLEAAGRVDSALGQLALFLARRIDGGQDTGSGLASLSKEWRACLDAATAGAPRPRSPLDELRERHARRFTDEEA